MKFIFWCLALLFPIVLSAQTKVSISGYLKDASNGEALIGASVYSDEAKTGTASNTFGFYSLSVSPGTHHLTVSYIGYETQKLVLQVVANKTQTIQLQPSGLGLKGADITAQAEKRNVQSTEMGVQRLDMKDVKKIPALLGEVDVVRTIQLLPGVTTVGEGATGFNVRGGNIDQNLILLDDAPIYSSSHLFGFFSIFNPDAVKETKLMKGGIPANYGGRLSSVLDVRQKDGNNKKFAASGGIGSITSRLTLEGPIVKDKASFLLSGRRSYADLFFPLAPASSGLRGTIFNFYDLNAKLNIILSEKDRLFFSAYKGQDNFKLADFVEFNWGNTTSTLRWNHVYNSRLFCNTSLIYSKYDYLLGTDFFKWTSAINNTHLKHDYTLSLNNKNTLSFGVQGTYYNLDPGKVTDNKFGPDQALQRKYGYEHAVYINNEQKVNSRLSLNYGLRASGFATVGRRFEGQYSNPNLPTDDTRLRQDTIPKGDLVSYYGGLEPRFSATYLLTDVSSIKLGYNRMKQYIHLVSNTTAAVPTDIYTITDRYIKPTNADQLALGYFQNFENNLYEFSVEGFYKKYTNLIDFVDGASLIGQAYLETQLRAGQGKSYGMELYLRKTKGTFTGWVSYTYSRTLRQVESINFGKWYSSNYDKPHNIALVGTYSPSKKWDFSAVFNYSTGRPVTLPNGVYSYYDLRIPVYGYRNNGRIPDYHRFDLSVTYTPKALKENQKYFSSWNLSVYNAYNRRNAYSIFFRVNDDTGKTEAVRLSIFGSFIPSITYNFNF